MSVGFSYFYLEEARLRFGASLATASTKASASLLGALSD